MKFFEHANLNIREPHRPKTRKTRNSKTKFGKLKKLENLMNFTNSKIKKFNKYHVILTLKKLEPTLECRIFNRVSWCSFRDWSRVIISCVCAHHFRGNFIKYFLLKTYWRKTLKIYRRMRSYVDLHKRSSWDLILSEI